MILIIRILLKKFFEKLRVGHTASHDIAMLDEGVQAAPYALAARCTVHAFEKTQNRPVVKQRQYFDGTLVGK
jgi:hypothetical protein